MAWGVFAPTAGPGRGALAGTYVGASGAIGVGVGVGANLLFGGTGRSIALQPLSVEGSVGINLSIRSFKSHAFLGPMNQSCPSHQHIPPGDRSHWE